MTNFAIYKTKLGLLKIQYENNYITMIKNIKDTEFTTIGKRSEISDKAYNQIIQYLNGERKQFDIPYKIEGTDFQKKVWNALCKIPYGQTKTYKEIAKEIGNEKACRAVGMANNKNPIAIVIPCHRVVGSNGKLVGYAGGIDIKEYLLSVERGLLK